MAPAPPARLQPPRVHRGSLGALKALHRELEDRNQSAASSLAEGLDETLTLPRLGLYGVRRQTKLDTSAPLRRDTSERMAA